MEKNNTEINSEKRVKVTDEIPTIEPTAPAQTEDNEPAAVAVPKVEKSEDGKEDKKKKKSILIIILCILVALLVLAFGGILLYQHFADTAANKDNLALEEKIKAQMGIMDGLTPAEIAESLRTVVDEGNLRVGINIHPVFVDGTSEGVLNIENHPNNHYNMRCEIVTDLNKDGEISDDEVIYHSGLMPINKDNPNPEQRGSHIGSDVLDVDLPAGTYDCTAMFSAYDVETDMKVGAVNSYIKITVLND